jgi:hypothetical protein
LLYQLFNSKLEREGWKGGRMEGWKNGRVEGGEGGRMGRAFFLFVH